MAFIAANFNPIGGQSRRGKAPQMWSYSSLDANTVVDLSGYFNDAYNLLEVGDLIFSVDWATAVGAGGTISGYGIHIVMTKASGVVDVAEATAGTVTNTD